MQYANNPMVAIHVNSPTETVPYHQQDALNWCGSACVLMILNSIGVRKAGGFSLDQKRVRMVAQNSSHSDPTYQWATAPDGLTAALNYFSERSDVPLPTKEGTTRRWELVSADTEEQLSRYIVWSLWRYKVPAIALVFGMQHWVVVGGCVTSRPPTSADDKGYSILGFHISDPWPPIPRELARNDRFKHQDQLDHTGAVVAADGCGTGWEGDLHSDSLGGRGVALRYVSYADWRHSDFSTPDRTRHSGYMTGVPPTVTLAARRGRPEVAVRSRWIGKFLAICDPVATASPRPSNSYADLLLERELLDWSTGLPTVATEPQAGWNQANPPLRQITPAQAVDIATAALNQPYSSADRSSVGPLYDLPALIPGINGLIGEPTLVETLDEPGRYIDEAAYYIVPIRMHDGRRVEVRVAARRPSILNDTDQQSSQNLELFLSLSAGSSNPYHKSKALYIMSEEQARQKIAGRTFRSAHGMRLQVPDNYSGPGKRVWKPCVESFDPCCPFFEFRVGAEGSQASYIYVRASDGKPFTQLTEHLGGA